MSALKKIFWISLIVKLILAAALPLTSDEAYYWVWSQHMQLSFYDHPPFVAWLFWLGDFVKWFPGSVRWPGVLLGQAGLALWLMTLKPFFSEEQRRLWLWFALLSPLVGGSGIIITPDLPLMFFYAAATYMFFQWQSTTDWKHSFLFGLAMGLGFSGKYMMVLFTLSLLPLIALSPSVRSGVRKTFMWIFLGAVVGASPVWIWNILNDFMSFKFQAAHGLGRSWKPEWTWHYIGTQIMLIFPVVIYWAVRGRRALPLAFSLLGWIPVFFFLFTTFRGYVEANWPIAAYPAIFALAVSQYPRNKWSLRFTLALWGTLLALLVAVILVRPAWSSKMKFREFYQFDNVISVGRNYQPLFARSYQMASKLQFELGRPIYKLKGMNRRDFFDYLEESAPQGPIYFVAVELKEDLPSLYLESGHKVIERIPVDEQFEILKVEVP